MTESIDKVLEHADTIVVGNNSKEFMEVLDRVRKDQVIVDLVRICDKASEDGKYDGICW